MYFQPSKEDNQRPFLQEFSSITIEYTRFYSSSLVLLCFSEGNRKGHSVKWICFDIDPQNHENPEEIAKKIIARCLDVFGENAVLLEASRPPDKSYHIWVFIDTPIPAYTAKFLGKRILEDCKLENAGVELFPKQIEIKQGGYGNAVKLPLGIHRKYGKQSCFLDSKTLEPISSEVLFSKTGASTNDDLLKIFNSIDSASLENKAVVLGDYWLNYCSLTADKVWTLLQNLKTAIKEVQN